MSEKWSERHLRAEKVQTLKERLLEEISDKKFAILTAFDITRCKSSCSDDVKEYVEALHNLYVVEDYLKDKGTFMGFHAIDRKEDVVVYKLNGNTLDWMLQNNHLLTDIMASIYHCGGCSEVVLSDRFFEFEVFGVIDRCLWDERQKDNASK